MSSLALKGRGTYCQKNQTQLRQEMQTNDDDTSKGLSTDVSGSCEPKSPGNKWER